MRRKQRLLFLPGASGNTDFWRPVAERLDEESVFQAYPGFGGVAARPDTTGMDDLLALVLDELRGRTHVVAQSMGGVLAVLSALRRPDRVLSLVLTATSGGLDTRALGAVDWRANFAATFPDLPDWFARERRDLSTELTRLSLPVLLLWGDRDPLSPVAVGERLLALLPRAELKVIAGGDHDVAHTHAAEVADHIRAHLQRCGG